MFNIFLNFDGFFADISFVFGPNIEGMSVAGTSPSPPCAVAGSADDTSKIRQVPFSCNPDLDQEIASIIVLCEL